MKFLAFSQTKLGSSLSLPAHGKGGKGNTISGGAFCEAKYKFRRRSKRGRGRRGVWPASPELPLRQVEDEASQRGEGGIPPRPSRSPAALLVESRTPHKSFLFLLEEKISRAQIKKYRENFFAGWQALASGGGAERQSSQSGFSLKKS